MNYNAHSISADRKLLQARKASVAKKLQERFIMFAPDGRNLNTISHTPLRPAVLPLKGKFKLIWILQNLLFT